MERSSAMKSMDHTDHTPASATTCPVCPVCPVCGGTGFYAVSVPVGHPLFGVALRCGCQAEPDAARQAAKLASASCLSAAMRAEMTFATFVPGESGEYARVVTACRAFAREPGDRWMVLWGLTGNGKTHLLAATTQELERHGHHPLYVVASDLLRYLRGGIEDGSADRRLELLRTVDVLLIDDLGAEHTTEWAHAQLYDVLDYRYRERRPVVLASNVPVDEWPFRLQSRARDTLRSQVFPLLADDYRLRQAELRRMARNRAMDQDVDQDVDEEDA